MRKLATLVILTMLCSLVCGAIPAGAVDSTYTVHTKVDNSDADTWVEDLAPGQVQTGKWVEVGDEPGVFEITLFAMGADYESAYQDGDPIGPLDPESEGVRITDVLGEQFQLRGEFEDGWGLEYDKANNTVTWVIGLENLGVEPSMVGFEVELKDGWKLDTWYETNERAFATFTPRSDNPFYYERNEDEYFAGGFDVSNLDFTVTGDVATLISVTIADHNDPALGPIVMSGSTLTVDGRTFDLGSTLNDPGLNGDGTFGYIGQYHNIGDLVVFYIWINGLYGPGSTTWFNITISDGGTGTVTAVSKSIDYTYQPKTGFSWAGDMVIVDFTNNGFIMITEDETLPATGDASVLLNVVSLVGLFVVGSAMTFKRRD